MKALLSSRAIVSWKKLEGYADINIQKKIVRSDSVGYLRDQFEKIPEKFRDPRIKAVLDDLAEQAPSKQHLIEWFVTVYRMGLRGSEISQDIMCEAINRVSHASAFSQRTLRYAVKWAIDNGYITQQWLPIGKRIELNQGWKTKKIRRYECTYKIRFLVSLLRVKSDKKDLHCPTLAKDAYNPNGELPKAVCLVDTALGKLLIQDQKMIIECKPDPLPADQKVSPNGDFKSSPRSHKPKGLACQFQRRLVKKCATTYRQSRNQFLHDAWIFWKPQTNKFNNMCYFIAATQTHEFYPEYAPTVFNWFEVITSFYFEDWHQRRKIFSRDIDPAVRQFANTWTPPEIKNETATKDEIDAFRNWSNSLCPPTGIAVRSENLKKYFESWPFARMTLSALYDGRINFNPKNLTSVFDWVRLIF